MKAHKQKDKDAEKRYQELCKKIHDSTELDPFEDEQAKKNRIANLKKDFKAFVAYYFPDYAEYESPEFHIKHANRMLKNKRIRVWTKWPRGHAKSVVNNLLIPMWLWINNDILFMVIVGENKEKGDLLLDDIRAEFEANQRIINDYGVQKTYGDWSEGSFKTKNGFIGKSLGMGQSPRGIRVKNRRPDYCSCDDWENEETTNNPKKQGKLARWLQTALMGAMDTGNRRLVISQNKFHPEMIFDLIIQSNKKNWIVDEVIAFDPATLESIAWPEKYSQQHWIEVVEEMTLVLALAEYCNEPYVEGKEFKDEMIQWTKLPALKDFKAIAAIWDVAYSASPKADFNAVRIWGLLDNKKYLIDCFVKRSKMRGPILWISMIQKEMEAKGITIFFKYESQFWNEELQREIELVEEECGFTLNLIKMDASKQNKYSRIVARLLPAYTNGRVYYNEKLKDHSDTQQGIYQLKGIEPGYTTKDDSPDADQYAFADLDSFSTVSAFKPRIGKQESRKF